jgi:hypothetical protein
VIDAGPARQALEALRPVIADAQEAVIARTLSDYRDGLLTPERALSAWAHLSGLRDVPGLLGDVVRLAERRVQAQLRSVGVASA